MSQARLASASGISVRTIRAIENGQHRSPHQATLHALAEGIGLNPADTDRLRRAWASPRSLRTFEELIANGSDVAGALAELSVQSSNVHRMVSTVHQYWVTDSRRVRRIDALGVVEALQDSHGKHLVFRGGDQSMDARLFRLVDTEGCRLVTRHHLPEQNAVMFELDLGRSLAAGETHMFAYGIDLGGNPPNDPDLAVVWHSLGDSDGMIDSFSRPCAMHLTRVRFEGGRPARVFRLAGHPEPEDVGPLEVDEWNSVHVVQQSLEPGTYGVGWTWD